MAKKLKLRTRNPVQKEGSSRGTLEILEPDEALPKGYLSNSAISSYMNCPKAFEFRYILGINLPPEVAMEEGISHHDALDMTNSNFIKKEEHLPDKIIVEKFKDTFSDKSKGISKLKWLDSGIQETEVIRRGEILLENYMDKFGRDLKPVSSEKKVEVMMGGVPVLGFMDVETKDEVNDYKVVKACKSQTDADNNLQLTIYSKASKKKKTSLICLTKTKNLDVKKVESTRTPGQIKSGEMLIASVADAIKKGSFPMCDPAGWNCSKKWCGYWKLCRGKNEG